MAIRSSEIKIHKPARNLSVFNLAVLLANVFRAANHPKVGFEDANETIDTLAAKLNKEFPVELSLLESALWSCNLMDEEGEFWHPRGLTFEQFVVKVFPRDKFNRVYNMLEEKYGRS